MANSTGGAIPINFKYCPYCRKVKKWEHWFPHNVDDMIKYFEDEGYEPVPIAEPCPSCEQ